MGGAPLKEAEVFGINACELLTLISSLALSIANNTPNDDELNLLANIFNQLGDTLATIAAQRSIQQ